MTTPFCKATCLKSWDGVSWYAFDLFGDSHGDILSIVCKDPILPYQLNDKEEIKEELFVDGSPLSWDNSVSQHEKFDQDKRYALLSTSLDPKVVFEGCLTLDGEAILDEDCPVQFRINMTGFYSYLMGADLCLSKNITISQGYWSQYTPFECSVLKACQSIKPGELISYQELALRAGWPKSARAVGNCLGKNTVLGAIPCHRVVPQRVLQKMAGAEGFSAIKNRDVGGFAYGSPLKYALLNHEYEVCNGRVR